MIYFKFFCEKTCRIVPWDGCGHKMQKWHSKCGFGGWLNFHVSPKPRSGKPGFQSQPLHKACLSCFWIQCCYVTCWVYSFSFVFTIPSNCRQARPLQWQVEVGCFLEKDTGSRKMLCRKNSKLGDFYGFCVNSSICLCIQQCRPYAQLDSKT